MNYKHLIVSSGFELACGALLGGFGAIIIKALERTKLAKIRRVLLSTLTGVCFGAIGWLGARLIIGMLTGNDKPNLILTFEVACGVGAVAGAIGATIRGAIGGIVTGLVLGAIFGGGFLIDSIVGAIGGLFGAVFFAFCLDQLRDAESANSPADEEPLSVSFPCEKCHKLLKVRKEHAGKKTRCSKCGAPLRIPP